ncbi:uncharacterized protein E0L32_006040 [Thyridium curvatum]|uniref:Enoyl reductase (ER) domain-containing protein n=1 Tax=Thyridium curvatum TaxID=1093900 RepID=A0A507B841_9PEZI|nr:uncharacterized protein E0L32_006040 [Thyridium curvatum]TPX13569.1 hypothetical protein E0L32_006040 [Thyridium curvatum]
MQLTMKALVGSKEGDYRLADNINIPAPGPGTVLCRVHAVALNPYDVMILDHFNTPGAIGGCDFAGTVIQIGEGVTRFNVGDRILGFTTGLNHAEKTAGAFAEFALARENASCRLPGALAFTEACSMGVAVAAAGLAIFQAPGLRLSMPQAEGTQGREKATILVSGGATATGTMAIQLLKIAGYTPIVTCSPGNNALCESYGASACFDYHSPTCGADIRAHTNNNLAHVLDCIADDETMNMCYKAIGSSGGIYTALRPVVTTVKYTRRDIRADWVMVETVLGVSAQHGSIGRPSSKEHQIFGSRLFAVIEQLLQDGRIKHHPVDVKDGGLANIPTELERLRAGDVRARKIVMPLIA